MLKWIKSLFSRAEKDSICTCFPNEIRIYERDGYRRHGAHVLVGTERPLSKMAKFSGESDEDFKKRKLVEIERDGARRLHGIFYHNDTK